LYGIFLHQIANIPISNSIFLSYVDEQGKQLVVSGDADNNIELSDGSELVITKLSGNKKSTRTLGSREYLRYYRQKPRPSPANNIAVTAELAARFAILKPILIFCVMLSMEIYSVPLQQIIVTW
jgi:hypothetical protein